VLDQQLVQRVAGALATDEGLVEKDWHIVHALAVIAAVDHGNAALAFSGGTSLSTGGDGGRQAECAHLARPHAAAGRQR